MAVWSGRDVVDFVERGRRAERAVDELAPPTAAVMVTMQSPRAARKVAQLLRDLARAGAKPVPAAKVAYDLAGRLERHGSVDDAGEPRIDVITLRLPARDTP